MLSASLRANMEAMMRAATSIVFLASLAFAQPGRHPRMAAPKDFAVMAWGSSPSEPEQLQGMHDAGLNISGFCRVQDLERVQAAGLTCFVRDGRLQSLDMQSLPPDSELRPRLAELTRQAGANPAALGFYLRDEPSAQMMPG